MNNIIITHMYILIATQHNTTHTHTHRHTHTHTQTHIHTDTHTHTHTHTHRQTHTDTPSVNQVYSNPVTVGGSIQAHNSTIVNQTLNGLQQLAAIRHCTHSQPTSPPLKTIPSSSQYTHLNAQCTTKISIFT